MKYLFLPEAQEEFFEAAFRYESEEPHLGLRFRQEVEHVIHRIVADPHLWRERRGGFRRVNCPVFPFYVAYFIRAEIVVVAAIAHGHRHPNYWKRRVS